MAIESEILFMSLISCAVSGVTLGYILYIYRMSQRTVHKLDQVIDDYLKK